MAEPLLRIRGLCVAFSTWQGVARVLREVDLDIQKGEILGLVGESGCGKSVLARTILRLLPEPPAQITAGEVRFKDRNLLKLERKALRTVRGNEISMIFQEPMTSLNPVYTVGNQMTEVVRLHQKVSRKAAVAICTEMLGQVNLPDPNRILQKYPHELSGGMRQRVMIAMELSCRPELLIADEPTTALDVTVQGQVLTILKELVRRQRVSVLFITHDMGVVAQTCDRVCVMYAGGIVEEADAVDLFADPAHPYTQGLIRAIPKVDARAASLTAIPGAVPDLTDPPPGCRFHPRCPHRHSPCDRRMPASFRVGPGHTAACHLYPRKTPS